MAPKLSPRIFPTAFRQLEKQWRSQSIFYNPRCGNWSLTSLKSSWGLFTGWMSSAWIYPALHSAMKSFTGKDIKPRSPQWDNWGDGHPLCPSGPVCRFIYSQIPRMNESTCPGASENPLKVLITSYKHFTTSEALIHKLSFTYGAQKAQKPPKLPKKWGVLVNRMVFASKSSTEIHEKEGGNYIFFLINLASKLSIWYS